MKLGMKILSGCLGSIICIQAPAFAAIAYAESLDELSGFERISLSNVEETNIDIVDGGVEFSLSVQEVGHKRIATLKNVRSGDLEVYIFDEDTGELSSSVSSEKIKIQSENFGEEGVSFRSSRSTYKDIYLSWRQLKTVTGGSGALTSVAAVIASASGVGAVPAAILNILGGLLNFAGAVMPDDAKHGLVITVKTSKWYRKGSKVSYKTTKDISGIRLY